MDKPKFKEQDQEIIKEVGAAKMAKTSVTIFNKLCRECRLHIMLGVRRNPSQKLRINPDTLCKECLAMAQKEWGGYAKK